MMEKKMILFIAALSLTVSVKAQRADSLRMDSIAHTLSEVTVKGERPAVTVQQGKLVYDMSILLQKKGVDNIYEALKEIPGVSEQNGKITLGGLSVTVVLDGKVSTMTPDQLETLLKSLPASRIGRIEVMYNAPAKMQVRGAMINIVLKHSPDGGMPLQGEANLAYNQEHDARFGERLSLLYSRGKFSMDMMYLHSHGNSYSTTGEASHHMLDDGTVHDINTREVEHSHDYGHDYRIGMDYNFAQNHQISFVYTGSISKSHNHQNTTGNVNGINLIGDHSNLHNMRLDYQAPFGMKLGAEMTYYHEPENQNLNSTLPTGSLYYIVNNDQRINRWKAYVSQEHQLGRNWSVNYGAVYTFSINHSLQNYTEVIQTTGDKPTSSFTRLREDNANVYFGFNKDFGKKLTLEASLAGEYYHTPVWHQWHLYPTVNLTYLPSAGNMLQLGLSSDHKYPDYWSMTNFSTYSNGGYNEITGNPYLKPSNEYQLQLVCVMKDKYQFVAWFSHKQDYFVQTPYQRHDRLTVSYQYQNLDFQQQAGAQTVLPFKLGSWLDSRMELTGLWMREKDAHFYDIPYDRHIMIGLATLKNTMTLSSKPFVTMSVDGSFQSGAIQATYDLPASGRLDASASWHFLKKEAILKVFCNDIFQTSVINPRINYMGQNLSMDFSCYRQFGVSFTYRFGGYKEKKREEVDRSRFH